MNLQFKNNPNVGKELLMLGAIAIILGSLYIWFNHLLSQI